MAQLGTQHTRNTQLLLALQLVGPHHVFPAVVINSSSDLRLLIEQVSYEDQTLGIEVDVLLWTRWLL